MTLEEKRIKELELAVLACLDIAEDALHPATFRGALSDIVSKLEAVVGANNQHLQSRAAKQRVKKPEPAAT